MEGVLILKRYQDEKFILLPYVVYIGQQFICRNVLPDSGHSARPWPFLSPGVYTCTCGSGTIFSPENPNTHLLESFTNTIRD